MGLILKKKIIFSNLAKIYSLETMATAAAVLVLLAISGLTNGCSEGNCVVDPFPVRVIREVFPTHGKAAASTNWRNAPWSDPENAFRQDVKHSWGSGIFSNDVRTPFPHLIWYDFPAERAFIPAEVSFRTRQDGHLDLGPIK